MLRCWTCRRRRLKCDGAVPHCKRCITSGMECLGYQKPLVWVEGVARRGPMKNRNFGEVLPVKPTNKITIIDYGLRSPEPSDSEQGVAYRRSTEPSLHVTPTEPVLQDLDFTSRFFIDYYSQRITPIIVLNDGPNNHYRKLLKLVGKSPAVTQAMIAIGTCHFLHDMTGHPFVNVPQAPPQLLAPPPEHATCNPAAQAANFNMSKAALINYYLRAKTNCLNLLASELSKDTKDKTDETALAVVTLLVLLETFETGAGSWAVHLEGAKQLLSVDGNTNQCHVFHQDVNSSSLILDVTTFLTFGRTLGKPTLTTENRNNAFALSGLGQLPPVTSVGCPMEIVNVLDCLDMQRRIANNDGACDITVIKATLKRIRDFDTCAWGTECSRILKESAFESQLTGLGEIWRVSAEIYAYHVLIHLTKDHSIQLPSVDHLISKLFALAEGDEKITKCFIWPTFVAGAASVNLEQRGSVLRMFHRIWLSTLCASARNAPVVLSLLWEKQDMMMDGNCLHTYPAEGMNRPRGEWDWIEALQSFDDCWLFL